MTRPPDQSAPPPGYPKLPPGMKPGDHPEFYRFPPPKGRSRESKIVLDHRGNFYNDGVRIDHPGMARAFASWIRRHPDNGRFILDNRYDWTYFTVEDAPFVVRSVSTDGNQCTLLLSDGSSELLDPTSLAADGDALYVGVKNGEFEAKFTPQAQASLMPLVAEGEDGQAALRLSGQTYSVRVRARPPGPL